MKTADEQKIKKALASISKLKHLESKDGGNDFCKGMARMADIMYDLCFKHGSSEEYKTAVRELVNHGRN
jgi:hypothetical protein